MKWFDKFLQSFDKGEYHGLVYRIKPWQYKKLMETAKSNKWNMLSQKQVDVFLRNMQIERSPWEDFGHYTNGEVNVDIRISMRTGLVNINIS